MIPVTVITGFLGAGKTTLLKRVLRQHGAVREFGVIVNDMSELEVDGELIRLGHAVDEERGTLISLHDGNISGRLRVDFAAALRQLRANGVRHVLVETSGSTYPAAVVDEIMACEGVELGAVAVLVDGRALLHDYAGGPVLTEAILKARRTGAATAEALLAEQLSAATVVLITRMDRVPESALPLMFQTIQALAPGATLAACAYGNVDAALLLDAPPYQRRARESAPPAAPEDISAIVLRDPRPIHPQRFYDCFAQHLPVGLYRSKGFLWFASRGDQCLLWNQAGGAMGLELLSYWRAHILAHDAKLLPEERADLADRLAAAHPVFGDRGCELTLIGRERERDAFAARLRECFCTGAEIARWEHGETFLDPWPKNLKMMV
jgi:G3E family GTPase